MANEIFTREDLIKSLEQGYEGADAEQQLLLDEARKHYGKHHALEMVRQTERWQYLDGLRVGFNTARDLAVSIQEPYLCEFPGSLEGREWTVDA